MSKVTNHPQLTFPTPEFRIEQGDEGDKIFDPVRRKMVVLTPEEWVRQHVIHYLHSEKGYPLSLLKVEKEFTYNKLSKRADIVACDNNGAPMLMVECKSYDVPITQEVFDQIVRYNMVMHVKTLLITNGINIYCCELDHLNYKPLQHIPAYKDLVKEKE